MVKIVKIYWILMRLRKRKYSGIVPNFLVYTTGWKVDPFIERKRMGMRHDAYNFIRFYFSSFLKILFIYS